MTSLLFVNMKFVEEEKILIKGLRELKGYTACQSVRVSEKMLDAKKLLIKILYASINLMFTNNSDVISGVQSTSCNKSKIK